MVMPSNIFFPVSHSSWNLRSNDTISLHQPFAHTNSYLYSCVPNSVSLWNQLPENIHHCLSLSSLAESLKTNISTMGPNIDIDFGYQIWFITVGSQKSVHAWRTLHVRTCSLKGKCAFSISFHIHPPINTHVYLQMQPVVIMWHCKVLLVAAERSVTLHNRCCLL